MSKATRETSADETMYLETKPTDHLFSQNTKIFVTGGTGFIGEELCLALRRRGHKVYALVRSLEKAKTLLQNEVDVVLGDMTRADTYSAIARQCSILIHTAWTIDDYERVDNLVVDNLIKIVNKDQSKLLVYTSGILVYGDNPNKFVTEEDATDAAGFLANRPKIEQKVCAASGVVVRPAFVYGKKSRHFFYYFQQAQSGNVVVQGRPEVAWSEVHIDDLIDGYLRIIDNSVRHVVRGQIFNFADSSNNTNLEIATALSKAAGYKGEIHVNLEGRKEHSDKTVLVDASKALALLKWQPGHVGLIQEADLYFESWRAFRS